MSPILPFEVELDGERLLVSLKHAGFLFFRMSEELLLQRYADAVAVVDINRAPLRLGDRELRLDAGSLEELRARIVLKELEFRWGHKLDMALTSRVLEQPNPLRYSLEACRRELGASQADNVAMTVHVLGVSEREVLSLIDYDELMARER